MRNWQKNDAHYTLEKTKYPHPVPSRAFILQTLKQHNKSLSVTALAKIFELNRNEKETLKHRIKAMLRDGEIEMRSTGKIRIARRQPKLLGKVFSHAEGYGFFIPEDKSLTDGQDLYLSYHEMREVMHGDIIEAKMLNHHRKGKREGKVISIIERANQKIIGRLVNEFGIRFVKAENRRIHHRILITNLTNIDVREKQIVEVSISAYPQKEQPIIGAITRVLGDKMDSGIEVDIAIANHNLPHEWPETVVKQTITMPDQVTEFDIKDRIDLRDLPLVTIDGITARDFDDAVYAKKNPTGYLLYVAIADVAHYVRKDSPLDIEAINRATSVYFPNRVIPMLPEKLSNGLCSLNSKVDRLCIVCEMLLGTDGNIKRSRFYEAVMKSHARLTYETVEDILFRDNPAIVDEYKHLLKPLQTLKALYQILRAQRQRRGAIGFYTQEPEFEYDAAGKIDRIIAKEGLRSHQLIEEFMVRANVCAANFLLKQKGKNNPIALFRNHQGPSEEKLDKLIIALAQENIFFKKQGPITPGQLSAILESAKDHANFHAIQMLVLRSMYQAVYQADNGGHFGLALDHYAHFTSPIRRYPDLLVHRAIKHHLNHKGELYVYSPEQMQQLGEQCSQYERRADDAVYDVIAYLKCEYMRDKLGQLFAATISGISNFGLFATLDGQFVDGLIHIKTLKGDYFTYDENRRVLIGERSRKVYKVGDKVDIIVSDANSDERRIDFILTEAFLPFASQDKKPKHRDEQTTKTAKKKRLRNRKK